MAIIKLKTVFLVLLSLWSFQSAEAQLLEALKKKAQEKGKQTREVSYDSSAKESFAGSEAEDIVINEAKDFFTTDVVMETYDKDGQLTQTSYFDAASIAMRTINPIVRQPLYHDRKGFFYAHNEEKGNYEKMSILPASSMGFMTAGMTTQAYKLPQEPYLNAFERLSAMDIALNFMVLEMAFIYKPFHFEGNTDYSMLEMICFPDVCKRFLYNDPAYEGSYIQFDNKGRLVEFYINSTNTQMGDNRNPSGKFVYRYEECEVELPEATEQSMIPGPLGKLLGMERGLEPWKHNKKDKIKQKN